jgi:hypothetical protein
MNRVLSVMLVAAVLASSPGRVRAEADPDTLAPPKLDLATLDRSYRRAKARRNIGIGLALPGIALNILGAVLFSYGITDNDQQHLLSQGNEIAWGAIVSLVGLGIAVPGVVFWIIDQDAMDILTWRRRQLSAVSWRPVVAPLSGGGMLGVSLRF